MDRFFRTQPPPRKSTVRLGTHAHSLKEINQTEKRQQAIAKDAASLTATAQSEFFGGVSVRKKRSLSLRLLAQSPGAAPSAPLQGCPVVWSSILKVGDSLAHQSFDLQADYKSLRFFCTSQHNHTIQLPDTSFMALESWDYSALRITQKFPLRRSPEHLSLIRFELDEQSRFFLNCFLKWNQLKLDRII